MKNGIVEPEETAVNSHSQIYLTTDGEFQTPMHLVQETFYPVVKRPNLNIYLNLVSR
jgi:hypothetical protein